MERKKPIKLNKKNIISASEIGQYVYCSISWYLQRCGCQPDSLLLDLGKKTHINLGNEIDNINFNIKKSKRYAILGYLFLTISFIGFLYEVIL